jgi:hypothetical protein
MVAAAVREGASSLARMAATWLETVRRPMASAAAISLSDQPLTSRRRTSISRGESVAGVIAYDTSLCAAAASTAAKLSSGCACPAARAVA